MQTGCNLSATVILALSPIRKTFPILSHSLLKVVTPSQTSRQAQLN